MMKKIETQHGSFEISEDLTQIFQGDLCAVVNPSAWRRWFYRLNKIATYAIPTAGVYFDEQSKRFCLLFNPLFLLGESQSARAGIYVHEASHILLGHCFKTTRGVAARLENIAEDAMINAECRALISQVQSIKPIFPECDMFEPGTVDLESAAYYLSRLTQAAKDNEKNQGGNNVGDPGLAGDDPSKTPGNAQGPNGQLPEDITVGGVEYTRYPTGEDAAIAKSEAISAARDWYTTCQGSNGASSAMLAAIRKFAFGSINWQAVLRQFIQKSVRGSSDKTWQRPNRKLPGVLRGRNVAYVARIGIYEDQSGSVGDKLIGAFRAELQGLASKHVSFAFTPFDSQCGETLECTAGKVPPYERVLCGYTDFDPVVNHANKAKFDAILILTDMGAPKPTVPSTVQRLWITYKGADKSCAGKDQVLEIPIAELD